MLINTPTFQPMRSLYFLTLVFSFFTICSIQAQNTLSPEQAAQVDAVFADWNKTDSPGASVGIIKDGQLVYGRGYGQANMEYDIPNATTSVFRIGSTSKQFTAACIVLLAQEGKLSLDDTLDSFFPDFPAYAKDITVRHLLHHTSGIRDYLTLASLSGLSDDDFYTNDTLMNWLQNQNELNFIPGEEHLYSNSGYWLMSQIVQKAANMTMAKYAKINIFNKLEMNNTHFHDDHTAIVKNRASGYAPTQNGSFVISMTTLNMIGDGGIFSTIEDAKKWDDAFYNQEVFGANFWKTMTTPGILNNGELLDYAFGLGVVTYNGLKEVSHGGAFVGFRAEHMRFPDQRFSVIIFANRADANPTGMAHQVADIFLKDDFMEETETSSNEEDNAYSAFAKAQPYPLSVAALKDLEGTFWGAENKISRKLEVRDDTLTYVRSNGQSTKMVPIAKDKFRWVGPPMTIVLSLNKSKSPTSFILDIEGQGISTYEKYTPITKLDEASREKYLGNYYSEELNATYTLKPLNGGVMLYVNEKPLAPAQPIMENIFNVYNGALTMVFSPDQKSFRIAAGRVKNVLFVKQ
ncbi:MAG: CubicO group peptidase (beta-lactamase class C family) [Dokdonia sp.]